MTNLNPKDEELKNIVFSSTITDKVNKAIQVMYNHYKDYYWEKAAEDMGIYVRDYYNPDGVALADLSYWANEDEIYERAREYFIDEMTDKKSSLSSEVFQYFEDEDSTEEEELLESKYLDSLNYSDYERIINNN